MAEVAVTSPSAALVRVFEAILEQRMRDLPILNPALAVEAIGFRRWNDFEVGILLTPWFMNLVLLPVSQDPDTNNHQDILHAFPAGEFPFVNHSEPGIGPFQMCSLFSPVFEFPNQASAEAVAQEVLEHLFRLPESQGISRRNLLQGRLQNREPHPA